MAALLCITQQCETLPGLPGPSQSLMAILVLFPFWLVCSNSSGWFQLVHPSWWWRLFVYLFAICYLIITSVPVFCPWWSWFSFLLLRVQSSLHIQSQILILVGYVVCKVIFFLWFIVYLCFLKRIFPKFFFLFFFFLKKKREKEQEHEWQRGRSKEQGREKIPSRLHSPCRAQQWAPSHNPEPKSRVIQLTEPPKCPINRIFSGAKFLVLMKPHLWFPL